ncbi:unnamed protein product [Paramecium sonneborni]|uniref:4-alpha-glucanotransferase n=1 Tax=Paramecium sonneborni TaxID=65129 RepID=A0A8S1R4V5_9CILI|nr:unnamed protein product [Paramecium sonneborni]
MLQDRYFLELNQLGEIEASHDKAIYVHLNWIVRIFVRNRKQDYYPYLIMQKGYKRVHDMDNQTLKQIQHHHDVKPFTLDSSGDWKLDVEFPFPGAAYLRLCWFVAQDQPVILGVENHIIVQPNNVEKLQELTIQTLLPYCLGKFEDYEKQIRSQVELGYEAFHLPPIQQLGQSTSLYAIADQQRLNTDIFGNHSLDDLKLLFAKFPNTHFFIDILLNHTAFDSKWLVEPEFENATYNVGNSPHLEVAIKLDCAIAEFSNKLGQGLLTQYPRNTIYNENDLNQIMEILERDYIRKLNIHDYFQFNINGVVNEIHSRCNKIVIEKSEQQEENQNIFIKSASEMILQMIGQETILKGYKEYGVSLNYEVLVEYLNKDENYKKVSLEYIRELLQYYNLQYWNEAEQYIKEAVNCTRGQITWWKLKQKNPQVEVNEKGDSLVPRYFTKLSNGKYVANNGWIQGFDPLNNFAENQDHHYLRRTIVIWGDLVKLRYGHKKQDSPALWKYMKKYVQQMAQIFSGLRLDNAHSTPMMVGEYMMRNARKANQNILVFAELFTGSSEKDSIFTKTMGINCLVRETNRCHDAGHLNRELHYYSGDGRMSIGSLPKLEEQFESMNETFTLLQPQYSPALIYEQSHDNESLLSTHGYKHQLPIASLISFSGCMGGSVRGYDQFIPNKLSVVNERRLYNIDQPLEQLIIQKQSVIVFRYDGLPNQQVEVFGSWNQWQTGLVLDLAINNIYSSTLNLNEGQYEYKYKVNSNWVDQNNRILIIQPNHQKLHTTMELVRLKLNQIKKELNTEFPFILCQNQGDTIQIITRETQDRCRSKVLITVPSFGIPNTFTSIKLPGQLIKVDAIFYHDDFIQHPEQNNQYIEASQVRIIQHSNIREFAEICDDHLNFVKLPSSFTAILECHIIPEQQNNLQSLDLILNDHSQQQLFNELTSSQLNYLLFMSEPEERDKNNKGLYFIPNYRQLIYAGFAGPRSATREAQTINNLAHPVCENLRNGNWLIDYLNDRVQYQLSLLQLSKLINTITNQIKNIPRHHIPSYFCKFIDFIYNHSIQSITNLQTSQFKRELKLASYQFIADLPSSKSMAAGLPHFTTGWARSWGRDTFISFKGIYLENGLLSEAREALLTFASCLRHGLIPNLLDSTNNPRYNCRDACWWYIKAVKDYIQYVQKPDILKEEVQMVFLDDDIDKHYQLKSQGIVIKRTLADIIQKIFQSHATGIKFREWRAGNQIDNCMQSEGFNIQLGLDEQTGFIVGGNWLNCLTWMDKMGSSDVNRGIPATSRDGAPIELTALLKVCLDFVSHSQPHYPYDGVICTNGKKLLFKEWSHFLIANFEKQYYIPKQHDPNYQDYQIVEKHVRHRQIYKDIVKSSKPRNEYQLRCNASVAIGLAPELFHKEKAMFHLATVEAYLLRENSIGIKTLDPAASEYIHFYDNSDQSHIFNVSHGFSYHNGPEWVWVYGYFIKALVAIHGKENINRQLFYSYLSNHKTTLHQNEWYSLPEMTNGNGEYNVFSCRAQAWSIACILEAVSEYE